MNWREYDAQAEKLEQRFQEAAPLLTWAVGRASDRSHEMPGYQLELFQVRASVVVQGHRLVGQVMLDRLFLDRASFDVVDYITESMAMNIAKSITTWGPEQ